MAEAKAYKMIPHCTKDTITYETDELVRCKDCKHVCLCVTTEIMPDIPVYAKCTLTDEVHDPDWFCADGEKRTD